MSLNRMKNHLGRLAGGFVRRRALTSLLIAITAVSAALVWFVAADRWLQFSPVACWTHWSAAMLVLATGLAFGAVRLIRRPSLSGTALLAEQRLSWTDNRLINAVQLEQGGHERLAQKLSGEIPDSVWRLRGSQLASRKPLVRCLQTLGVLGLVLAALFAWNPRTTCRSILRLATPMAGLPPMTDTRIVAVKPGAAVVARADRLVVTVAMQGEIPETVHLLRRIADGTDDEMQADAVPVESAPGTAKAMFSLEELSASFQYRIQAGDAASGWYGVTVQHPPELDAWTAHVTPPPYTGLPASTLSGDTENPTVPEDSRVKFVGTATCELRSASVIHPRIQAAATDLTGGGFHLVFAARERPRPALRMESSYGLAMQRPIPFEIKADAPPLLRLVDTPLRQEAPKAAASIPVAFRAEDEYGVTRVGLERMHANGSVEAIRTVAPPNARSEFAARFVLDLASFAADPGEELRFRLWAEDNGPDAASRRAHSPVLAIQIPAKPRPDDEKSAVDASRDRLAEIIDLQRRALLGTRSLQERVQLTGELDTERLLELRASQREVRGKTGALLEAAPPLGDLVNVLHSLLEHEMIQALDAFERVRRQPDASKSQALLAVIDPQETILASLTGVTESVPAETLYQNRVDLFAALQDLIKGQQEILKATRGLNQADEVPKDLRRPLAKRQDGLARDYLTFQDLCNQAMDTAGGDTFAKQVRIAYDGLREGRVYERMLGAAEELELGDLPLAEEREAVVLRHLLEALDILNSWRAENAKRRLADAVEAVRDTVEALDEMEKKQAMIAEVTRDITKRGMDDPEVRDKLGEMDEEQKEMKDLIEKLAQDLYQFPELPVCNELNSKMRELFEDVQQALNSENAAAAEIAVQKEDSFLDAIRNTKERAEDMEMWLPDVPDTVAWNMESFDVDEFPDMPLVPLPDELEDLVGELLDQADPADQDAQDATGNNMMADGPMGWDVMDGPIPNFSAKGKSGNTRPNDNEMTGRSGAGREGQSSGELVEDHVKGLEGREPHARRTRDPLQSGQVTEDEESTLDARGTGGGKLGGQSETVGMFGNSPRRDLHTPAHGDDHQALRREAEALYAKARLLYLKSGKLGLAARDLRTLEDTIPDIQSVESVGRKVLRRLSESQVEIREGVALPMPVTSAAQSGGTGVQDVDLSAVDSEYRHLIGDYYRSLSE